MISEIAGLKIQINSDDGDIFKIKKYFMKLFIRNSILY